MFSKKKFNNVFISIYVCLSFYEKPKIKSLYETRKRK